MNEFWLLGFRNLWARKTRTLITAMGILLGVAAMFAVSVMGASTQQSLVAFFAQSSGRANLTITQAGASGDGLPRRILARVQARPDVEEAVGLTRGRVTLSAQDKPIVLSIYGIDPEADARVRTYKLTAGRFLVAREKSHNLLLVSTFASKHALALGDTLPVRLPSGDEEKFRVIGLLADEGAGHLEGGSVAFVNLEVADAVFSRANRLDQIDLVADPAIAASSARVNELKAALQEEIGDKYIVALPTATGESVSQAISGLNQGLGFFGIIALFVGMLLIYNTFQMTVAERTREIGMLRSLGATREQILALMLTEALVLGLIGTAMGIGGGLVLSIPLVQFMSNMMELPLESFAVPMDGLVQATLVGLVTTLIAAFLPAWSASRLAPTEALRARAGGKDGFLLRHSWKIGLVLITLAILETVGVFTLGPGPQFFIFVFLGTILLMPSIILLFERVGRGALAVVYGAMGPLGSRNLARSRVRTSLTVGVLMIGVVMTVAIGATTSSFKVSMDDWVAAAIGGDFIITSSDSMRQEFQQDVRAVEGVAAASGQRLIWQKVTGVTNAKGYAARNDELLFVGVDVPTYRQVGTFQFVGGEDENQALGELESGDAILVSTTLRERWACTRGDTVSLRTARGIRDFKVAGIVATFWSGGQSIFLSRRAIEKDFGDTRVDLIIVKKTPEISSAELEERLEASIGKDKRISIQAADDYRASMTTSMNQFMLMFDAMVWIAVIVGALGVVNTMTMNVLERIREIATLRSIGMSQGQLARMILAEAGAMGVIGSLFGVAIAVPVSFIMVEGMRQGSGFQMHYVFPGSSFWMAVAIALLISQLASVYPTWRAGNVNMITAIKEE